MPAPVQPRCDQTAAWAALGQRFASEGAAFDVRRALRDDPQRVERFSQQAPFVFADMSKNLVDGSTEDLLLQLASECGLEAQRDAMFRGDPINGTEGRAVMHFLLRAPRGGAGPAGELAKVH